MSTMSGTAGRIATLLALALGAFAICTGAYMGPSIDNPRDRELSSLLDYSGAEPS